MPTLKVGRNITGGNQKENDDGDGDDDVANGW